MSEKIDAFLKQDLGAAGIFYLIGFSILAIILLLGVIIILRMAYHIERIKGVHAFTLPKSIAVAVVPGIYFALAGFDIDVSRYGKAVAIATVVIVLIVALMNFRTFGALGCFTMTFSQCLYGSLIVLGVMSIAFIVVAGAAMAIAMLFGGGGGDPVGGSSSGIPSSIRDVSTNENFHVTKGVNGMYYVNRHGTDVPIRNSSFAGRYIDDYGNEYV